MGVPMIAARAVSVLIVIGLSTVGAHGIADDGEHAASIVQRLAIEEDDSRRAAVIREFGTLEELPPCIIALIARHLLYPDPGLSRDQYRFALLDALRRAGTKGKPGLPFVVGMALEGRRAEGSDYEKLILDVISAICPAQQDVVRIMPRPGAWKAGLLVLRMREPEST